MAAVDQVASPGGTINVAVSGRIATITLTDPSRRNALNREMLEVLSREFARLSADVSVAAVVITGAGDQFSAGLDIRTLDETLGSPFTDAIASVARFPGVTIASIRGMCIGGGVGLAAACDLRIASQDAVFGVTPAQLGVLYPAQATQALVALIGVGATKRLLLTGELVDSLTASNLGLTTEVVPDHSLEQRVAQLGETIASRSDYSVAGSKKMIDAIVWGADPEEVERQWRQQPAAPVDGDIGRQAFAAKTRPSFRWRRTVR
ncbi:enoyl-CoA hydratase/isomerase family protein [Herbiconiux ginsengi]|uniref:Enoyl-CoA hydratase/carnithine racemase n=1 Tax=Herbiconiux ginsengi TaxID=381665 RepID=A0A1H3TC34_9MICO|nr:enoyl-CoA hydratase/isomerase family protein [Herbiconiux ginsengi]SDZ47784.1 Enoyl-CoA hydratase/carnithine racemase [Herbiconiux ginsengi]